MEEEMIAGIVARDDQSRELGMFAAALAKAQGAFGVVRKDRTASVKSDKGSFEYGYGTHASVLAATRPALSAVEIAITQRPRSADGTVSVETMLVHSSGQWMSCTLSAPMPREGRMSQVQAMGSIITYLCRYALKSMLGVSADDDDDDTDGAEDEEPPQMRPPRSLARPARAESDDTDVPFQPASRSPRPAAQQEDPWKEVVSGHVGAILSAPDVGAVMAQLDAAKSLDPEAWNAAGDVMKKSAIRKIIDISSDVRQLAHAGELAKSTKASPEWHNETKELYSARRKALIAAAPAGK